MRKSFKIDATIANLRWVKNNLTPDDYLETSMYIIIYYYNDAQKSNIIKAINS